MDNVLKQKKTGRNDYNSNNVTCRWCIGL